MKNVILGIFKDQNGNGSSKRIIMFWSMALITYMVIKQTTDKEIYWGILGLVLTFGGYTTSEFFKKK